MNVLDNPQRRLKENWKIVVAWTGRTWNAVATITFPGVVYGFNEDGATKGDAYQKCVRRIESDDTPANPAHRV